MTTVNRRPMIWLFFFFSCFICQDLYSTKSLAAWHPTHSIQMNNMDFFRYIMSNSLPSTCLGMQDWPISFMQFSVLYAKVFRKSAIGQETIDCSFIFYASKTINWLAKSIVWMFDYFLIVKMKKGHVICYFLCCLHQSQVIRTIFFNL